jgi:toxin ParE1/3/4
VARKSVKKTPRAYTDIEQIADYLHGKVGAKLALRFLDAAESTSQMLARMPTLGAKCERGPTSSKILRTWQVKGFEKYLIFFRELRSGIEVIRVLHGSQEWEKHLEETDV